MSSPSGLIGMGFSGTVETFSPEAMRFSKVRQGKNRSEHQALLNRARNVNPAVAS